MAMSPSGHYGNRHCRSLSGEDRLEARLPSADSRSSPRSLSHSGIACWLPAASKAMTATSWLAASNVDMVRSPAAFLQPGPSDTAESQREANWLFSNAHYGRRNSSTDRDSVIMTLI